MSPTENTEIRISAQIDQFTQFDKDSIQFPFDNKEEACDYYCHTIGFNTLSYSQTIKSIFATLTLGGLVGIADDGISEYLQNDYSHAKNNVAPVPRGAVKSGVIFGVSAEANNSMYFSKKIFYGTGFLANNIYSEFYVHTGIWNGNINLFRDVFGIQYSLTSRIGLLSETKEYLFLGQKYFSDLYFLNNTTQAEAGIFLDVFNVPIGLSWRGSYSTGVFKKRSKPVGMFVEGLKTTIWKFSFERYNDALNNTDYGPTYGIKLNFIL